MRSTIWTLTALMASLASGPVGAQTTLIKHSFDESVEGWTAFGDSASISVTNDAANVKSGKGALKFAYKLAKGEIDALALPTPNAMLGKMKSLRFWIKSDHVSPFIVSLAEHEGGKYNAVFTAPSNKWQLVELAPTDFLLAVDKNDPKDPNGKLDLDQVENLTMVDVGTFFAQSDNGELTKIFNIKPGAHTVYLDDFAVTEDIVPAAANSLNGDFRIDTFVHPQVAWIGLGTLSISAADGKPLDGRGIKVEYHQTPMAFAGIIRGISKGKLTGATKLSFDLASTKPAKFIVQLEEVSGGKYNYTMVSLDGGGVAKRVELPFSEFTASEDSKDDNGKLDLDQVKSILILDISGGLENADSDNTLWLGVIRAIGAK